MAALVAVSDRIEANDGIASAHAIPANRKPEPRLQTVAPQGLYGFAFTPAPELTAAGVFYATSDIPNRLA
jgi:hypothetical protein